MTAREALRQISRIAVEMTNGTMGHVPVTRAEVDDWAMRICDIIGAVEQPRNCDVGTFEEQRKRFKAFCRDRQYGLCDGCPVVRNGFCTLYWAQMPYEEGGAE